MNLQHNRHPDQFKFIAYVFLIIMFLLTLLLINSCKTIEVPYPVKTVREVYKEIEKRDSIWVHDSIYVRVTTDTVFMEKWHTKYIEKTRIDSIIKTDSIPIPYEVKVPYPVEKKLSLIQKVQINIGKYVLILVLAILGIFILKKFFKYNFF